MAVADDAASAHAAAALRRWPQFLRAQVDATLVQLAPSCPELARCTWGARNVVRIRHPLSRALPGSPASSTCRRCTCPGITTCRGCRMAPLAPRSASPSPRARGGGLPGAARRRERAPALAVLPRGFLRWARGEALPLLPGRERAHAHPDARLVALSFRLWRRARMVRAVTDDASRRSMAATPPGERAVAGSSAGGAANAAVWFGLSISAPTARATARGERHAGRSPELRDANPATLIHQKAVVCRQDEERAACSYYGAAARLAALRPALSPEWRREAQRGEAAARRIAGRFEAQRPSARLPHTGSTTRAPSASAVHSTCCSAGERSFCSSPSTSIFLNCRRFSSMTDGSFPGPKPWKRRRRAFAPSSAHCLRAAAASSPTSRRCRTGRPSATRCSTTRTGAPAF